MCQTLYQVLRSEGDKNRCDGSWPLGVYSLAWEQALIIQIISFLPGQVLGEKGT